MPPLGDLGVVLVLDEEKGDLGEVALELNRLGIDALYSNDAYEGTLLARQEGRRVGGVFVAATSEPKRIDELIESICPETDLHPEAIAVLGERPPRYVLEGYLERGLRWCLWRPYPTEGLRLLGSLTLWESNDASLRLDVRVPIDLPAKLTCRGQPQSARVIDLSRGGAKLNVETRLPPGRRVQLEVGPEGAPTRLSAIVRWTTAFRRGDTATSPGMGVEFEHVSPAARHSVDEWIQQAVERFRIRAD